MLTESYGNFGLAKACGPPAARQRRAAVMTVSRLSLTDLAAEVGRRFGGPSLVDLGPVRKSAETSVVWVLSKSMA